MDFLKEIVKEIGDDFTQLASDIDEHEDMEYDIVTNLSCPTCGSYVEVYHKIQK